MEIENHSNRKPTKNKCGDLLHPKHSVQIPIKIDIYTMNLIIFCKEKKQLKYHLK